MEAVVESPTKSAPPETCEALTLLAQGKRHLLVKDYHEAVSSLAKASELLAKHYGDDAKECGDAYLYYGKALLELARSETGVLGDALGDEDAEAGSSDEDEEGANGEAEKDPENGEAEPEKVEEEPEKATDAVPSSEIKEAGDGETKEEPSASSSTGGEDESTKKGEDGEEEDNEEDISNLKLAWEMLELAKLIFQRETDNKQTSLKLADVYLLLGEVSLESETYQQAVEDMQNCLKIQQQHLDADDRRIAETFYQLGTAFALNNEFDQSLQQYTNAIELIELRIKNLEEKVKSGEKPEETDAFYTMEGEINELKELLPEVHEKVTEMKEMKKETLNAVSKMIAADGSGSSKEEKEVPAESPVKAAAKPVSDISHLVRKKRKADEGGDASAVVTAEDGKGTANGQEDGPLPAKIPKGK